MTNVIAFPEPHRVEIYRGLWMNGFTIDEKNMRLLSHKIGVSMIFVEAVNPDGRLLLWVGQDYDEAKRQAEHFTAQHGPVWDQAKEGGT